MNKSRLDTLQSLVASQAASGGRELVSMVTDSQRLLHITKTVVIEIGKDLSPVLYIFRESSSKLGSYSREKYRLKDDRWKLEGKEKRKKYDNVDIPSDAIERQIDGYSIFTRMEMTEAEEKALRVLLSKRNVALAGSR